MEGGKKMRKKIRKIFIRVRIQLRLFRLLFLRVEKPPDAKSQEEMLEAIKKRKESGTFLH